MRRWLLLTGFIAIWFAPLASAQQWLAFVPPERDFRVAMPAPATLITTREGSAQYRADYGGVEYSVIRHDPRRLWEVPGVREDLIRRMSSDDRNARPLGEDGGDLAPNEFLFKVGSWTMHRVFTERGQYYELVVKSYDPDVAIDRELARDYFASFRMARGSRFVEFVTIPGLEICNGRANAMARILCQYVVCMQPGYESQPVCRALPGLQRN